MPEIATLVTGAAGFIGSHLVDRLLTDGRRVIGVDNFVRGTRKNLAPALSNPRFILVEAELDDEAATEKALSPYLGDTLIETVWHMAANSDIAAGVNDPRVDLRDTFMTTFTVLALMRKYEIGELAFASSSAVHGDRGTVLTEDTGPFFPISSYGAMKLGCEGLISAAVESHLTHAWILRFPNVVGPRSTHGVIFDLLNKIRLDDAELEVLGNGKQKKPYLHVTELIDAMIYIYITAKSPLNYFNIGPEDDGVTVDFIAREVLNAASGRQRIRYTGGCQGWVGDVPLFSYSIEKLLNLGWKPTMSSEDAIRRAAREIAQEQGM